MFKDIQIHKSESIKNTLKQLDKTAEKVLLVVDDKHTFLGTITDGDIRRFILRTGNLESNIEGIYNKKPAYLRENDFSMDKARNMIMENGIELIPVLNLDNKVVNSITWKRAFSESDVPYVAKHKQIDVPVVIMAGGKSTRLEPFSKIFPKPLIPIGDKPIAEIIIDEFKKQGINDYYLILNYKSEMIESYFNNIEKDYQLKYIREDDFRGTAGGLKLLEKNISDNFIVSNCDVIVKANFEDVLNFHKDEKALLTVLSSFQHHKIPYGVIRFEEGGRVTDIIEKPEYTFTINAGVYILNKEALNFMPEKSHFHTTDLIKILLKNGKKVLTYPVNENDYIDIGQWEEYKKAIEKLHFLDR